MKNDFYIIKQRLKNILIWNCDFIKFNFKNLHNMARHKCKTPCWWHRNVKTCGNMYYIQRFLWYVQNATVPCRSQDLLPFLSVMHFFLPPLSATYSFILSHFILPSISWSTSQSCCSQIHIYYSFGNSVFFHSLYIP